MGFDHRTQHLSIGGAPERSAPGPGKHTLTENLAVQHKAASPASAVTTGDAIPVAAAPSPATSAPPATLQMLFGAPRPAASDPAQVHAAAERGTATAATQLPHFDAIQRSFGRHDVSAIQAHVGADATASARDMGAAAYATGNHVVLGDKADLHTAAHEAAHVVQQRGGVQLAGGVGQSGDAYEQHADAVADLVVQGKSSEAVLDRMAGDRTAEHHGPVQRTLAAGLPLGTEVVRHEPAGDLEGFTITKVPGRFGGYTIEGNDARPFKNVSTADIAWGTKADQEASRSNFEKKLEAKQKTAAGEELRKKLIVGENYLSADYRRINPLLAAFESEGYKAEQVRDRAFDYSAKKPQILAAMKAIALSRNYTTADSADTWDTSYVDDTYAMLRTILDVWNRFPTPQANGGVPYTRVYRGDSKFLYSSFPALDPGLASNGYKDGENAVSLSITMPQILSTTYGDPKSHNYVAGKSVVWDIRLPAAHEGKGLGANNQSEQEMSFPVGTTLAVHKLLVRVTDKTQHADVYGPDAEVIVMADLTSAPASGESSEPK